MLHNVTTPYCIVRVVVRLTRGVRFQRIDPPTLRQSPVTLSTPLPPRRRRRRQLHSTNECGLCNGCRMEGKPQDIAASPTGSLGDGVYSSRGSVGAGSPSDGGGRRSMHSASDYDADTKGEDATSASGSKARGPKRKPHSKSRKGCATCKRRRVKVRFTKFTFYFFFFFSEFRPDLCLTTNCCSCTNL